MLIPIGGGGLASGIATAIKATPADGVEIVGIRSQCALADGIAVKQPGRDHRAAARAAARRGW